MLIPTILTITINIISRPTITFVILCLALLILGLVVAIRARGTQRKIIVDDKYITYINLLSTRKLLISEIKGHRIGGGVVRLIPISQLEKPIIIEHIFDFDNSDEFVDWLWANFDDLKNTDQKGEEKALLENTSFGATKDAVLKNLAATKQSVSGYNYNGFVLSFICFILVAISYIASLTNTLNRYYTVFLLLFPLYGLYMIIKSKGLISISAIPGNSVRPSVFIGFVIPSILLFINSKRFDTVNDKPWIWVGILITTAVLLLFYSTLKRRVTAPNGGELLSFLFAASIFGFGAARQINYVYDTSPIVVYRAKVLGRGERMNRSLHYYITMSPWGPQKEVREIKVSWNTYLFCESNDSIQVYCKEGLLHTPWFVVVTKK